MICVVRSMQNCILFIDEYRPIYINNTYVIGQKTMSWVVHVMLEEIKDPQKILVGNMNKRPLERYGVDKG